MSKILGLDLGTNSIGWAVVDEQQKKILGTGSRIFQEGVENLGLGKKEKSKNASRREHRQSRRQYFRKRLRKIKLLELLIKHEMCPLSIDELNQWKHYDKSKGKTAMQFPSSDEITEWLKMNPYELRAKGLEQKLTLLEFGRVLYHLIQRRGFWSNRKVKEEGKINTGNDANTGIADAKEKVGEDKSFRTLGEYLYSISKKDGTPYERKMEGNQEQRVRARYTLRKMYIDEFEQLWSEQAQILKLDTIKESIKKIYPIGNPYENGKKDNGLKKRLQKRLDYLKHKGVNAELEIDDSAPSNTKLKTEKIVSLRELLAGGEIIKQEESVLFYQRPLRIQRHLLDECSFEKTIRNEQGKVIYSGKKPCPASHPLSELRRAYEFINNIEYGDRVRLNDEQRQIVLNEINKNDKNFDFQKIPKALKLEHEKFNYDSKHKVKGNYTHKHLIPLFAKETWEKHSEEIWHCFHFYNDNEKLIEKLKKDFDLAEKFEDKIIGIIQPDGSRKGGISIDDEYSGLSLKAIKNILPFLEKGYRYSDAVILGGVRNSFGDRLKDYFEKYHEEIEHDVIKILKQKNKEGEAIEKIKSYLIENKCGFVENDDAFLGLYHHSQDTEKTELKNELDEPENLRNPLVQQSILELRSLVNAISKEYLENGQRFNQIKVEMARDLKQSKQKRIDQWSSNKEREKENDEARTRLDEYGLAHSRNNIHKYLLWKELGDESGNATCPYTGKTISISELFNDNKFQIEHIIPYSVSLDDSFGNKTICDAEENGRKGELTPYEFYGKDEKKWDEVSERAFKVLPYFKAKRFTQKKIDKDDFISRQLNDTRYISKAAKNYLKQICADVRVFPGQLTADLRRKWGLENIINPPIEVNGEADFGKVWAKLNENNEAVAFYPIYNKAPKYEKGEFVITGEVQKGKFKSKYLSFETAVENIEDGKYWAKITVNQNPVKLVQISRPLPDKSEDEILLFGKSEGKGKFSSKYLNQKLNIEEQEKDISYWAKLKVVPDKTSFFHAKDKKLPKAKKNHVLVFGKVKDGIFSSKIYNCKTNIDDGKYSALLEVDFESISFHKVKNEAPKTDQSKIRLAGNVKNNSFQSRIDRRNFYDVNATNDGLHWAVFEIKEQPHEFTLVKNTLPKTDNSELVEGTIALANVIEADFDSGEVFKEEERKYFFPSKDRGDHRHHAIDALVVAMTEQGYLQHLSTYNANKKEKIRGKQFDKSKLSFPEPWDGDFREQAEKHIKSILVSHKKINRVLTKKKTKDQKTGKINEGIGARGQLHKEFVFGERTPPKKEKAFHIRKSLNDIKNNKHIYKIVDDRIRNLILNHLRENYPTLKVNENFNVPPDAFFKEDENGIKQPRLFLPNKNGSPVPIKKVRIREKIGGAEKLKETNQHVNPRNNHHVLIYKKNDGSIDETTITFWTATERMKQKQPVVQLPADGREIIATLQINDTFLIGVDEESIDWDNQSLLSNHLFRVQKISEGYYTFRHHLASTLDNSKEEVTVQSFKKWLEVNPIKMKVSRTGKIIKA